MRHERQERHERHDITREYSCSLFIALYRTRYHLLSLVIAHLISHQESARLPNTATLSPPENDMFDRRLPALESHRCLCVFSVRDKWYAAEISVTCVNPCTAFPSL